MTSRILAVPSESRALLAEYLAHGRKLLLGVLHSPAAFVPFLDDRIELALPLTRPAATEPRFSRHGQLALVDGVRDGVTERLDG